MKNLSKHHFSILVGIVLLFACIFVVAKTINFNELISKSSQNKTATPQQVATPTVPKPTQETTVTLSAVGDFDYNQNTFNTLVSIKKQKPSYVLALGDLSYGKVPEQQWCDTIASNLDKTPFAITVGNHDIEAKSQIDLFSSCLPNRVSNVTGNYPDKYYFDHDKLFRIISIAPNIALHGSQNTYAKNSPEYTWLTTAVADAKKQNIRWIIVTMHENCITIGEKSCEIGNDLNAYLFANNVDLVLQGHEHGYMRTYQLATSANCKQIQPKKVNPQSCVTSDSKDTYKKNIGTVQAIVGTGGAELRDIQLNAKENNLFASAYGANKSPTYGALQLAISNNTLKASFISNDAGAVKDSFSINYNN